jgi:hypothetical protein
LLHARGKVKIKGDSFELKREETKSKTECRRRIAKGGTEQEAECLVMVDGGWLYGSVAKGHIS